ncbi:MAG: nucleotidyltransferase [Candidatus Uhrbacteria bacterium]|nr:nucleotidyltransferase [Candidatus Uhrbacteria bacterium]
MDMNEQFKKMYENIKLTSDQRKDAKTKYTGVCKKLHDHYYPNVEYSGNTKLLIGSYGKHTNIRPPRDIDVIFVMPEEKWGQYADNTRNPQSQLLQDVKKILSEKYTTTEKIRSWGKVVLVKFSDGTHDVEVLPAWRNHDGTFKIPNSENGGSWEYWDPKSEINNIDSSDKDTDGATRMLIRMIKKWTDNCSIKMKSHVIEKAIINYFSSAIVGSSHAIMVQNFLQFFLDITLDQDTRSHITTALNRAKKANEFEQAQKLDEATNEWKKVFGEDFPARAGETKLNTRPPKPIINPPKPWLSHF